MPRKQSVILTSKNDDTKEAAIKKLRAQVRDLTREAEERRLAIGHQTSELTRVMVQLQDVQSELNILTNRGDIVP